MTAIIRQQGGNGNMSAFWGRKLAKRLFGGGLMKNPMQLLSFAKRTQGTTNLIDSFDR